MKKTTGIALLVTWVMLFTGCSMKNIKVSKVETNFQVKSSKTLISGNSKSIEIKNELELEKTYKTRECGDKNVYMGFGTNYLKGMFGLDTYNLKGKKYGKDIAIFYWIASPVALPFCTGIELLSLQPFYDYKDIHTCNEYKTDTEDKDTNDYGKFTGKVVVKSSDGINNREFNIKAKKIPLKISFKDENDMFSTSRKSFDMTNGYTVNITGNYDIDGKSVPVKESKYIK